MTNKKELEAGVIYKLDSQLYPEDVSLQLFCEGVPSKLMWRCKYGSWYYNAVNDICDWTIEDDAIDYYRFTEFCLWPKRISKENSWPFDLIRSAFVPYSFNPDDDAALLLMRLKQKGYIIEKIENPKQDQNIYDAYIGSDGIILKTLNEFMEDMSGEVLNWIKEALTDDGYLIIHKDELNIMPDGAENV